MTTVNARRFYVYAYLRTDGTPYYIGKGNGYRIHESSRRIALPPDDRRKILVDGLSEDDAFEYEIALIYCLVRKDKGTGCLRNLTDGGEGASNPSAETLAKRSAKLKQVEHTSEWINKRVQACLDRAADKYGIHRGTWRSFDEKKRSVVRGRYNRGLRGADALLGPSQKERRSIELAQMLGIEPHVWLGLPEVRRSVLSTRHKRTGKRGEELLTVGPSRAGQRMMEAARRNGCFLKEWQALPSSERSRICKNTNRAMKRKSTGKNGNFKPQVWRHPEHGEVVCPAKELTARFGAANLPALKRGAIKHSKGWVWAGAAA